MINTAVILIRFSVSIFGTFDCWILFFFSSLYLYSYLTYLIIHLISLARNTFLYPPDLLPFILLYPLMPAQIKYKKTAFLNARICVHGKLSKSISLKSSSLCSLQEAGQKQLLHLVRFANPANHQSF